MMSGGKRWRLKEMVSIPKGYTGIQIAVRSLNVTMPGFGGLLMLSNGLRNPTNCGKLNLTEASGTLPLFRLVQALAADRRLGHLPQR